MIQLHASADFLMHTLPQTVSPPMLLPFSDHSSHSWYDLTSKLSKVILIAKPFGVKFATIPTYLIHYTDSGIDYPRALHAPSSRDGDICLASLGPSFPPYYPATVADHGPCPPTQSELQSPIHLRPNQWLCCKVSTTQVIRADRPCIHWLLSGLATDS